MPACSTVVPCFVTHGSTRLGRGLAGRARRVRRRRSPRARTASPTGPPPTPRSPPAPAIDVVVHVCVDDAGLVPQPLVDTDPAVGRPRRGAPARRHLHLPGRPRPLRARPAPGASCWSRPPPASPAPVASCPRRTGGRRGPRAGEVGGAAVGSAGHHRQRGARAPGSRRTRAGRRRRRSTRHPSWDGSPTCATTSRPTIALFAAPTSGGITGSTVIVDGGSVMAP